MEKKVVVSFSIGTYVGILTFIFLTLKFCGVITWGWVWVVSPVWIWVVASIGYGIIKALAEDN